MPSQKASKGIQTDNEMFMTYQQALDQKIIEDNNLKLKVNSMVREELFNYFEAMDFRISQDHEKFKIQLYALDFLYGDTTGVISSILQNKLDALCQLVNKHIVSYC